jgi:hypothetical protein
VQRENSVIAGNPKRKAKRGERVGNGNAVPTIVTEDDSLPSDIAAMMENDTPISKFCTWPPFWATCSAILTSPENQAVTSMSISDFI